MSNSVTGNVIVVCAGNAMSRPFFFVLYCTRSYSILSLAASFLAVGITDDCVFRVVRFAKYTKHTYLTSSRTWYFVTIIPFYPYLLIVQ